MEVRNRGPLTPSPVNAAPPAKTPSRSKPKEYTKEEIEKWETEKEVISYEYSPSTLSAWRLFLLVQLVAAFYNYISDCDEVFNYWEPTHFMQYGRGLQTWEYRSFFFFFILLFPLDSHILLFSILHSLLSSPMNLLICYSLLSLTLYSAISRHSSFFPTSLFNSLHNLTTSFPIIFSLESHQMSCDVVLSGPFVPTSIFSPNFSSRSSLKPSRPIRFFCSHP